MSTTKHTFCRICESLCGLEVTVEAGRVIDIRPDRLHVTSRGQACAKGLHQHEIYGSPDRIRRPLKREGKSFHEIPWATALGEIGEKLRRIRRERGKDSMGLYVGTAAGFGFLHAIFAQGLMTGLGSKNIFSSATQDCSNKFAVAREIYGFPFLQPFPDVERCECLIVVGSNPAVSQWSFLQLPRPVSKLRELAARGRLVYVDPRRTESAELTGEHLPIRPGTDVFFYLSFLNELVRTGGVRREQVARFMSGFDAVERIAERWPAERTAPVTRIPAASLRSLVASYNSGPSALYCSTGVNMGPHGSLAFWLQEVINAVSGNLDRPGGTLVGKGIVDFPGFCKSRGVLVGRHKSRIGAFSAVNDAFPGGILADEILTPGDGQIRGLICSGGNPLLTMANAGRLSRALKELELLVVVDLFRNETAELAHYVLPATSPLERPDIPFSFPLLLGMQHTPYLQATDWVADPVGEAWEEARIFTELAQAARAPIFGSWAAQALLLNGFRLHDGFGPLAELGLRSEHILSLVLRAGKQAGGYPALLDSPHGALLEPSRPGSFLGKRVLTQDGKIQLAPEALLADAAKLETVFESEAEHRHELRLIIKRTVRTHNSWTHNVARFLRHEGSTNFLFMHPDDASAAGLRDGDCADVRSSAATVRVPVRLTPDMLPGTVALPHGWGHQRAPGLSLAHATSGVNANLLAADGPSGVDPFSGMSRLTAIAVEVHRADGPQEKGSWSGLPE